ncbi:hypothetical protein M4D58_11030 [Brevibacillus borstelensis]|uniref:TrlF family AAA-like ATPase n=1 Tax=Brevibacillus borstelensis TaxID=45462 RepID=UPI002041994A|nr:hypothetical protein [Brevibacillus borstelensis]MCM3591152.1 hypothetical protein [Brevibacillus borstelensis]
MSYIRGSEWRKWDLHIHTPKSIEQRYNGDTPEVWDKFVEHLESLPSDVGVIGINDYYFIDGYEKLMKEYRFNGRLKNILKIFPVLEFRIDTFGAANPSELQKVNLHIVFNVNEEDFDNDIKQIKEEFIERINVSSLKIHATKKLSRENLQLCSSDNTLKSGFAQLIPSTEQVFDLLNSEIWRNKVFLLLGYKEWNNLDKGNQLKPFKEQLYDRVSAFFTASQDDNTTKKDIILSHFGNKKLLHSTDIHGFDQLTDYKCYTWIKGDPTFEGLKQFIFEPDRINIQENNPQHDFKKPYFSHISINSTTIFPKQKVRFSDTKLELNPNLVAIIGGRGSGKSILLSSIAKMFNKTSRIVNDIEIQKNFDITFTKQDGSSDIFNIETENNLDYLHVHQGEVKGIAENPEQLHKEIKSLLGLKDRKTDDEVENVRGAILNKIQEINDWFTTSDQHGNLIHNKEYNEKLMKKNEDFIKTVTTEQNASLIKQYRDNNIILGSVENSVGTLTQLKKRVIESVASLQAEIQKANELIDIEENKIPLLDCEPQINAIDKALSIKNAQLKVITETNNLIKSQFQQAGIEGDITSLLEKVKNYQEEIDSIKDIINEIELKEKELSELYEKRHNIGNELFSELQSEIKEIEGEWIKLLSGRDGWSDEQKNIVSELLSDIEIYGDIHIDLNYFYSTISNFINRTKFRSTGGETSDQKIRKTINVENPDDFLRLIKNEKIINLAGESISLQEFLEYEDFFTRNGEKELLQFLFSALHRSKYLFVIAKTKYKGKDPSELSVGQRGTFYVCLKLATDPFLTPFVFDQPEDDLDNNFIMEQLVPLFKKIKKYRQIIVVTHNANIVVNADAEQIIVASNNSEELSYISGSLEHTLKAQGKEGIREYVCNILEGGERAFKNRELKYGI